MNVMYFDPDWQALHIRPHHTKDQNCHWRTG